MCVVDVFFFFFQAEDGIRDAQESRGLGEVYKRQRRHRSASGDSWYAPATTRIAAAASRLPSSPGAVAPIPGMAGFIPGMPAWPAVPARVASRSGATPRAVSYTHLRAHETPEHLVCRL